jgi:hypothetical protein
MAVARRQSCVTMQIALYVDAVVIKQQLIKILTGSELVTFNVSRIERVTIPCTRHINYSRYKKIS